MCLIKKIVDPDIIIDKCLFVSEITGDVFQNILKAKLNTQ